MARRDLVTRSDLRRALAVNALSKPLNVAVPAGVLVAGLLLGTRWLIPVAVGVYVLLALLTFFDEQEAERVGRRVYGTARGEVHRADVRRMAPPIAGQVRAARACGERIDETIARSEGSFSDLGGEVQGLVGAIEAIAERADRIYQYLATQDVAALDRRLAQLRAQGAASGPVWDALCEQRTALSELQAQLDRFYAQIEHMNASLNTVNAQVVQMSVATADADEGRLADQVRGMRDQVDTLSAGMKEAYGRAEDTPPLPSGGGPSGPAPA
jgi:hypothetical protein